MEGCLSCVHYIRNRTHLFPSTMSDFIDNKLTRDSGFADSNLSSNPDSLDNQVDIEVFTV